MILLPLLFSTNPQKLHENAEIMQQAAREKERGLKKARA
jgi:hypothetical protein